MRRGRDVYRTIESLLRRNGAVLKKSKKHRHWKFPDGAAWIVPCSPRNDSGFYNNLADLKKYLRTGHSACSPARDVILRQKSMPCLSGGHARAKSGVIKSSTDVSSVVNDLIDPQYGRDVVQPTVAGIAHE
jgi:hypothetical protein